jgi:hypothetical protein
MGLYLDRCKAATNAAGTGAVTPGSAVTPFRTWSGAGATAGYWYTYLIEQNYSGGIPADVEHGVGLYNGTTITRPGPGTDPWFSSTSGSLLNVNGTDSTVASVPNNYDLAYGGIFMPPLASYFPSTIGAGAPVLSNSKGMGLVFNFNVAETAGDDGRGVYKTVTAGGDWQAIARVRTNWVESNFTYGGMFLGRTGGRNLYFGPIHQNGGCSIFSSNMSADMLVWQANFGTGHANYSQTIDWFRISYTSATGTIAFDYGMDYGGPGDEDWESYGSTTTTAQSFGGAPDKVGLVVIPNISYSRPPRIHCPYWWDNA